MAAFAVALTSAVAFAVAVAVAFAFAIAIAIAIAVAIAVVVARSIGCHSRRESASVVAVALSSLAYPLKGKPTHRYRPGDDVLIDSVQNSNVRCRYNPSLPMSSKPLRLESSTFPTEMVFQGKWRTYQARLLDSLHAYLDDNHVHIVAAPGSGKTIFGIEVLRRINKPTLVLAPTTTIRDQWAERLTQQFLPFGSATPDWVSTDIRNPQLLTIVTYQALHALCSGRPEPSESQDIEEDISSSSATAMEDANGNANGNRKEQVSLPDNLSGFETLVVDEAHHLKAEWWRTLTFVVDRLKPTVIALTATPPYDVSPYEWQRYEELCGPVDAEISIPELVLQGDLSPHQDYLYFTLPTAEEQKSLADFRASVDSFVNQLRANRELATALLAHPWIIDPDSHIEEILCRPEYLSSFVVFLHAAGAEIPRNIFNVLGVSSKAIPQLDLAWLEILLTHCLYDDSANFPAITPLLKNLRHDLLQMGAIEHRKVVLRHPSVQARLLTTSRTKLRSVEEIVRLEAGSMKERLRCVVLTDFIRKADLPNSISSRAEFEDIGAVPIFETLRSANIPGLRDRHRTGRPFTSTHGERSRLFDLGDEGHSPAGCCPPDHLRV